MELCIHLAYPFKGNQEKIKREREIEREAERHRDRERDRET